MWLRRLCHAVHGYRKCRLLLRRCVYFCHLHRIGMRGIQNQFRPFFLKKIRHLPLSHPSGVDGRFSHPLRPQRHIRWPHRHRPEYPGRRAAWKARTPSVVPANTTTLYIFVSSWRYHFSAQLFCLRISNEYGSKHIHLGIPKCRKAHKLCVLSSRPIWLTIPQTVSGLLC